jgi:tetratricopeptide (TPR) repeat protein
LALLGLGGLLAAARARGRLDPSELAAETRLALKERHWDRAGALLARLAQRRPPTADDVVLRAELELGLGRPDRAIGLLTGIPESDPHAARARLVAGQIEKSRDRARGMEALFREALRLDPKLAAARRELIFLYGMQARRADLNAQYRALAELEALGYDDVFLWMNSFENRWINDLIRSHLERYLAADPGDRLSRLALAGVLVRYNDLEGAEALLLPLPESDPDARVLRARIALSRMRMDEVRSILDRGPTEHVDLALLRGQFAVALKDPAAAARQFRIALRLDPTCREALEGLSAMLKQLGDREGADSAQRQADLWRRLTSLLQKAHVHHIRDKALFTQLGETCEALGQFPEARAWYRLALDQDPLDPDVQKSLYRVRDRVRQPGLQGPVAGSGTDRRRSG